MKLSKEQSFLVEALKQPSSSDPNRLLALYHQIGQATALRVATDNWVEPAVGHRLMDLPGLPAHEKALWRQVHLEQERWSDVVFHWVAVLARIFADLGFAFIPMKDTGLSLIAYPCRACRKAEDVDILVPAEAFARLEALLTPYGFRLHYDDPYGRPREYLSHVAGQMEFVLDVDGRPLKLEFHHRPLSGKWIQPEQEPSPSDLFRRAFKVSLGDTEVSVLAHEDNLLHLCVHAAKHFFVLDKAIRMYMDIDRLISTGKMDWGLLVRLAVQHQVILPARLALHITTELFGTEVPSHVMERLRVPSRREQLILHWVYRLGVFEPSDQKLSRAERFLFYFLLADSAAGSWRILSRTFAPPVSHLKLRYGFDLDLFVPYYYAYNAARIVVLRQL